MNNSLELRLGIVGYDEFEIHSDGAHHWANNVLISRENKFFIREGVYESVTFIPSELQLWVEDKLYNIDLKRV